MRRVLLILVVFCVLMGAVFCASAEANGGAAEVSGYTRLDDLAGKRIGVMTGSIFDVVALDRWPDAKTLYYENIAGLVIALQQDKIDAFLTDEPLARQVALTTEGVVTLGELLGSDQYGFAFAMTPEGLKFRDEFNAFLRTAEDGELLKNMDSRWFNTDETRKTVPAADALPATNGVIRFASNMESEPLNYIKDGQPVGYEIDLITRFCAERGYGLSISTASFGSLLPGLAAGRFDVVAASISVTEERAQSVYFSDPTYIGGMVATVRAPESSPAGVPAETARIASLTGTVCESCVNEAYPQARYNSFPDVSSCMMALEAGQVDYAAVDDVAAKNYIRRNSAYDIYGESLDRIEYSIGIDKQQPELLTRINELLSRYEEDGTLAEMRERWIDADSVDYVMPEIPTIEGAPALRVATAAIFEPMGFYMNGVLVGFDIELSQRLAYDMGMRAEIEDTAFTSLIPALQSGKADVILSSLFPTEERRREVYFSQGYYDVEIVLVRYDADARASATVRYDAAESQEEDLLASLSESFRKNFIVEARWRMLASGVGITLLLSVCSGILGILVGFVFCLARRSRFSALCWTVAAFTRLLQGTPIVVLLMILYYVVFNKTGLDGISVSIIAFGLNFGAYASEIMLSGISAVDGGQSEAAAAIGYSPSRTFTKIVFPQAARHFLPVLKGEYISLVKMISIVGYVAVQDLTKVSDIIRSRTYEAFFPLIVTAIIYFLLSFGLSSLLKLIEVHVDPKRRARTLKGVKLS